jgi:RNA polymerase sigma-70 factor (ECF subfamily)
MECQSDEQLIEAIMRGNQSALAPLVERYHAPLLGYLYRLTDGNRPLAEDLVQDTFIRVLQQHSYQPERPFKPWLYSIATHLAYDHFRSLRSHPTHLLDDLTEPELVDRAAGPEEMAQAMNEADQVAGALRQVGAEYRAALLLRFYGGLSLKEIGVALHIPLGTVKSRLSVGTHRLRSLLERMWNGEER